MLIFKTAPSPAFSVFTPRPGSPYDSRIQAVESLKDTVVRENYSIALENNSDFEALEANIASDDDVYLMHQRLLSSNVQAPQVSEASPNSSLQRSSFSGNITCKSIPRAIQDRSDNPEVLLSRFREHFCPRLSIAAGQNNMWQTRVLPMANSTPSLWNAISAMAALHIPTDGRLRIHGAELMGRSIGALNQELEGQPLGVGTVATILILAFWARCDHGLHNVNVHINGAMEALRIIWTRPLEKASRAALDNELLLLAFLSDSCIHMHTLSSLVNSAIADCGYRVLPMVTFCKASQPHFLEVAWPPDLWTFCTNGLCLFMRQAADLCYEVRMATRNADTLSNDASSLMFKLEEWKPQHPSRCGVQVFDTNTKYLTHTAEACRYTTMLYLQQAVPLGMSTKKLAHDVFCHLSCVPPSSVTLSQIYPLFVVGCEASSNGERQWVKERWEVMIARMRVQNVSRCWEITQEVWKRRDAYRQTRNESMAIYDLESDSGSMGDDFEESDLEFLVGGRLHWASVMKDLDWEVSF